MLSRKCNRSTPKMLRLAKKTTAKARFSRTTCAQCHTPMTKATYGTGKVIGGCWVCSKATYGTGKVIGGCWVCSSCSM